MYSNDDFKKDDLATLKQKAGEDLFELIGAKDIPDDEKGVIIAKMVEVVSGRSIARLGESLSPEDRLKLEELVIAEDDDAVDKFIAEKCPNFDSFFEEEAQKLRQELIIDLGE